MAKQEQDRLLLDHGDMRLIETQSTGVAPDHDAIVQLDPDHPGFRDKEYRARRNAIAAMALDYRVGTPIPDAPYTPEEHLLWGKIGDALEVSHQQHACAEYLECVRKLDLPRDRIPQLAEVSERIKILSGFRLAPVSGLVEPRVFLESLAEGIFLCTQYIRHYSTPHYTPEPDVVHEITGHAVSLASGRLAELNRLVGQAVKRTSSPAALERLSRVYWFTMEFGVLLEGGELKAYGTGLLSSVGELDAMHRAELRPFDLERASREKYDPTRYQPLLFCADSFETMCIELREFLIHFD